MSDTAAPDTPATWAPPSVRRWPRIAVTVGFVVHGLLLASWTAHIPDVKAHLGLTQGTWGFALLGAPVGSVTAMIASAYLPLAVVATIGFTAGLLTGRPAAALAGFASLGIGLASVVPAVFGAAGHITGLHPGTAVAIASACGWAGFVCGPPLIGQITSLPSLPAALGLLPLLTAFILVGTSLARALKTQPQHHGRPAGAGSTP